MKRHLITVTLILMGYAIKLTAMPVMKWDHGIGAEVKQPTIPKLVGTIEEGKGLPKEALSVEAWVRIEKPTRWGGILSAIQDNGSYERGWLLGYENQQFCFALATEKTNRLTYLKDPESYSTGLWYHVVGTYDGKTQRIYVDGQPKATSSTQSGPILYPPKLPLSLGAYRDDNENYPLEGQVAYTALWNRSLTAKEILQQFNARKQEFPGAEPSQNAPVLAGDWPTYQHDNARSGRTPQELPFPLHLQWSRQINIPPKPAWPPPAKQDFWHNKYNLQPRVTYDRAFHLVGDDNRAYFGSSADDQVRCLDMTNGEILWSFFAEGPVRLAPTLKGDRLLFGADDGFAYCLNPKTGKLLWRTKANTNPSRRIPGNSRLISPWPVRSSIVVEGSVAYLCAGLFPNQGAWHLALDIHTGKIVDSKPIQFSPQGYLAQRGGQLHIPTGRDRKGRTLTPSQRRSKSKSLARPVESPREYPFSAIATPTHRIAGGDGAIAAFQTETGETTWKEEVPGRAYGLSIIGGKLVVSTDDGTILCFGPEKIKPKQILREHPPRINQPPLEQVSAAKEALTSLQGYALVLGATGTQTLRNLANSTQFHVVAAVSDIRLAAKLRRELNEQLLYGSRITVQILSSSQSLPYSDYLFNCILEDKLGSPAPDYWQKDIPRLLQPLNGVAINRAGILERGKPVDGAGEWTHLYANAANTACSMDQRTSGKLSLQWFGLPGPEKMLDRHHRSIPPLWKNGRLFVPGNERVYGVDAYNGTVLWERATPGSRRVGIFRDCGSMAASAEALYVAAEGTCYALSPETGKTLRTFEAKHPAGDSVHWGLVAYTKNLLVGSTTRPNASRKTHSMATIREGTYWDNRPAITSNSLFAHERKNGKPKWQYIPETGALLNPSFTLTEDKAYFLESRNPATLQAKDGRATYAQFVESHGADLVAIDLVTGKEAWRQPLQFPKGVQNSSLLCAKGRLVLQYSRNDKTVRYDSRAFDSSSGNLLWTQTQDNRNRPGGDHGEQDHHPVVIDDKLIIEPLAYDLATGKRLPEYDLRRHGHGCGTMSASASSLYFRATNPTEYLLGERKLRRITTVSRPGCWINIIPAGGLVLIPEASSGCTCDFAVQASMAFLPSGKPQTESTK